jgi:hypothetical protein
MKLLAAVVLSGLAPRAAAVRRRQRRAVGGAQQQTGSAQPIPSRPNEAAHAYHSADTGPRPPVLRLPRQRHVARPAATQDALWHTSPRTGLDRSKSSGSTDRDVWPRQP